MCDITFAHQSKSLIHILMSLPVIPRRPQTNSLKCQVCWRVNKPKLEWQQINGAPCPLLIMSWIHIQGLTNKTGLHKWATAVWRQQKLQIRLKVPCYAHSLILQGYWRMFTWFHIGKTHFSYCPLIWHLYLPSVWALGFSACLFKAPEKLRLLWLVSSHRPEQAPPTVFS